MNINKLMESKKKQVLEELFKICKRKNDFVFHNNLVKDISKRPKTYFPHRTKTSFEYNFGKDIKKK